MGGIQSTPGGPQGLSLPKCPSPFESVGNFACVMPCPTEKGYERRTVNGGFQCVYKAEPQNSTTLNTVSATIFTGSTLSDLQRVDGKAGLRLSRWRRCPFLTT